MVTLGRGKEDSHGPTPAKASSLFYRMKAGKAPREKHPGAVGLPLLSLSDFTFYQVGKGGDKQEL